MLTKLPTRKVMNPGIISKKKILNKVNNFAFENIIK